MINIQLIQAVVAMVPHPRSGNIGVDTLRNHMYVVEKMGLDILQAAGVVESSGEGDDI